MAREGHLAVRVVNDIAELARVATLIEEFCARCDIPPLIAGQVVLALEEVLTNTIHHGFADAGRHEIALDIVKEGGDLVIDIADDGRPFDPLQGPAADLTSPLEARSLGGLGLHLIKAMMDGVAYRRGCSRNHLTLRKRIGPRGD